MRQATQEQKEIARTAIHAIFGQLSTADLERLAGANKGIETANFHYGLNAQVAANKNFDAVLEDVINTAYYIDELADRIAAPTSERIAVLQGRLAEVSAECSKVRAALHKANAKLAELKAHPQYERSKAERNRRRP